MQNYTICDTIFIDMNERMRRTLAIIAAVCGLGIFLWLNADSYEPEVDVPAEIIGVSEDSPLAIEILKTLDVKGRAPKTGYAREEFYSSWGKINSCDVRNVILYRDLTEVSLDGCIVLSGTLNDPYTGEVINFVRGNGTSSAVQIDHIVALSDAWQKGAQQLTAEERYSLSQDPLNLLAVDGPANQQKGDGDAATWLPKNKGFRCQYIALQIAVKHKYRLWVTSAEKEAMERVLSSCPEQQTII